MVQETFNPYYMLYILYVMRRPVENHEILSFIDKQWARDAEGVKDSSFFVLLANGTWAFTPHSALMASVRKCSGGGQLGARLGFLAKRGYIRKNKKTLKWSMTALGNKVVQAGVIKHTAVEVLRNARNILRTDCDFIESMLGLAGETP